MLIDGCLFTTPDFGPAARFWREVTPRLGKLLQKQVFFLSRVPLAPPFQHDDSVRVLQAPPLDMRDPALEQRRLAALCGELSAPLFVSTRYTIAAPVPSIFVLADNFPYMSEISVGALLTRQQAIETAAICCTLSSDAADYLASGYQVPKSKIRVLGEGGDPFADADKLAAQFAAAVQEVMPAQN